MSDKMAAVRASEFSGIKTTYLNTAFMGPLPLRTQTRLKEIVDRHADPSFLAYKWLDFAETMRARVADFTGSSANQISLNASTSEVISILAHGFAFSDDDEIALIEGEYPSDILPWLHFQKARVRFYPRGLLADPKKLVETLAPRTRILNLSHVSFQNGDRVDVKALSDALAGRNIISILDVTQSFGGLALAPLERQHIDVVVCSVYKWLLAPYGQAITVWSDRAIQLTRPNHVGWMMMPQAPKDLTHYTTDLKQGARKFDRGQAPNILGLNGLDASLSLFSELGLKEIESHNQKLVNFFLDHYPKQKFKLLTTTPLKSNILCLQAQGISSDDLQQKLKNANVDVSVREGNLRLSFHFFNSTAEVEKVLSVF